LVEAVVDLVGLAAAVREVAGRVAVGRELHCNIGTQIPEVMPSQARAQHFAANSRSFPFG
jgi:hypothetical protein